MTFYACVAVGTADCTPDVQNYIQGSTEEEFRAELQACIQEWEAEWPEFYSYELTMPKAGHDNWSQRVRIAKGDVDVVLDVIGMTADEWFAQQDDYLCNHVYQQTPYHTQHVHVYRCIKCGDEEERDYS